MPRRLYAILAISLAASVAAFDAAIPNVALPTIAQDLAVQPSEVIQVVTIYQLILVMTMLPLAALGDRIGHRRLYIGGLLLYCGASLVMMYARFPRSLRNAEDLLFERGIDISHETVPYWWNRFGPRFASDIRRQRVNRMRGFRHWRWHVDEMLYLWRAVDQEGEILESYVTKTRTRRLP